MNWQDKKAVVIISVVTVMFTVGISRGADPVADLEGKKYVYTNFSTTGAGPDNLHVKSDHNVKSTYADSFPLDSVQITATGNSGKNILAATAIGRNANADAYYLVDGVFVGGSSGSTTYWKARYNKGPLRIKIEINEDGESDNNIPCCGSSAILNVMLLGGDPEQTYTLTFADTGTGNVTDLYPVTLSGGFGYVSRILGGIGPGNVTITVSCTGATPKSIETMVFAVPDRVEVTGPANANHGDTKPYTAKAFAGNVEVTQYCIFNWCNSRWGFADGTGKIVPTIYHGSTTAAAANNIKLEVSYDGSAIDPAYQINIGDTAGLNARVFAKVICGDTVVEGFKDTKVSTGDYVSAIGSKDIVGTEKETIGAWQAGSAVGSFAFIAPVAVPMTVPGSLSHTDASTISVSASLKVGVTLKVKVPFVAEGGTNIEVTASATYTSTKTYTTTLGFSIDRHPTDLEIDPQPTKTVRVNIYHAPVELEAQFKLKEKWTTSTGFQILWDTGTATQTVNGWAAKIRNYYVD